jgi:hypothetical protein
MQQHTVAVARRDADAIVASEPELPLEAATPSLHASSRQSANVAGLISACAAGVAGATEWRGPRSDAAARQAQLRPLPAAAVS